MDNRFPVESFNSPDGFFSPSWFCHNASLDYNVTLQDNNVCSCQSQKLAEIRNTHLSQSHYAAPAHVRRSKTAESLLCSNQETPLPNELCTCYDAMPQLQLPVNLERGRSRNNSKYPPVTRTVIKDNAHPRRSRSVTRDNAGKIENPSSQSHHFVVNNYHNSNPVNYVNVKQSFYLHQPDYSTQVNNDWCTCHISNSQAKITNSHNKPTQPSPYTCSSNFIQTAKQDSHEVTRTKNKPYVAPVKQQYHAVASDKDLTQLNPKSGMNQTQIRTTQPPYVRQRKRQYRIGLNLFNREPVKGMQFWLDNDFLENSAKAIAKYLHNRKGISRVMLGKYLRSKDALNSQILRHFTELFDFRDMPLDEAIRSILCHFLLPGEAQDIARVVEVFASRYYQCNSSQFYDVDCVYLLSYATILLNTDLHNPSVKSSSKMKVSDFCSNLRGQNKSSTGEKCDFDQMMLKSIYDRIRNNQLQTAPDHVSLVKKVDESIIGNKKPALVEQHRRLICYCRLFEVPGDLSRKDYSALHQREVFLFNDILVLTKVNAKPKSKPVLYTFKQSVPVTGLKVYLFETPFFKFGIQLRKPDEVTPVVSLNARNESDRTNFLHDLKECILECNEMQKLLQQSSSHNLRTDGSNKISTSVRLPSPNLRRSDKSPRQSPKCDSRLPTRKIQQGASAAENHSNYLRPSSAKEANRRSDGSIDSGIIIPPTLHTQHSSADDHLPPCEEQVAE